VAVEVHHIGEVATRVGISIRTIRYYEEADLVTPSGRSRGGFRLYTATDIERLHLIAHLKALDLTIGEMRDLCSSRDRLARSSLDQSTHTELQERLATYAALAEYRCARLRDQLQRAETASRTLGREAETARLR
jgi:MerR family copper efflux transcriptional regulator